MTYPPEETNYLGGRRLRIWLAAGIGISIITVAALFAVYKARGDLEITKAFNDLDWRFIVAALGLHIAAHAAWAARLYSVAQGMGWHMPYKLAFKTITAGLFGAAVTPARVGGDTVRFALLRNHGGSGQALQAILGDRTFDLVFFIIAGFLGALSIPIFFGAGAIWVQSLAYLGIVFFALLLTLVVLSITWRSGLRTLLRPATGFLVRIAPDRGPGWLRAGGDALDEVRTGVVSLMRERRGWLVVGASWTLATWMLEFGVLWVLLQGFGYDVDFVPVFLAGVLLTVVTSLPLTPGGSGIAELAAIALYTPLAPGLTPAFVLVWRLVTYFYDLVVGGWVAVRNVGEMFGDAPHMAADSESE